jgi:arylsulfatase A-like enzyme
MLVSLSLVWILGCTPAEPPPPTIRLMDATEPLVEVPPVVATEGQPSPQPLLALDFELGVGGFQKQPSTVKVRSKDGALCVDAAKKGTSAARRVIPLHNAQPIDLSLRMNATGIRPDGDAAGAGLVVRELNGEREVVTEHLDNPRLFGTKPWTDVKIGFTPHSRTRFLQIDLQAASGPARGTACFDDLQVVPVSGEGMYDVWFGPVTGAHSWMRSVSVGKDQRPVLLAPNDSAWVLPAAADRSAVLRFGVSAWPQGTEPKSKPCLRVRNHEAVLWQRCSKGKDKAEWLDVHVPLPKAEADHLLRFESTTDGGEALSLWSDPRVVRDMETKRPDVVLIVVDTLRADHLGVEGYGVRNTSPVLDEWAASSVRFAQAQATSGWTATSLGSVVTGLLPSRHRAGERRVRAFVPSAMSKEQRKNTSYLAIRPDASTLAELLRADGYETVGFTTNGFFGPRIGFHRGFSSYRTIAANNVNGAIGVAEAVGEWRKQRLGKGPTDPVFLTVHIVDPHHPYRIRLPANEGFAVPEELELVTETARGVEARVLRDVSREAQKHPEAVQMLYDAEIRHVDQVLGELLTTLKDDNTVYVLLSDHGEGFGEHGHFVHGNSLYQELLHVPLWIRAPGLSPAVVDEPVSLADVAPTVLSLVDVAADAPLDGQAILPAQPTGRVLYSEGMYQGPRHLGLRQGQYKYIRPLLTPVTRKDRVLKTVPEEELYDLVADPDEMTNLALSQPSVVSELRTKMMTHVGGAIPGVHLRCDLDATQRATVHVNGTLGRVQVMEVSPGDLVSVEPGHQEVRVVSDGFYVVIESVGALSDLSLRIGKSEPWRGPVPDPASPAKVGNCEIWQVLRAAVGSTLGEDDMEALRALGYVD